jgi:hypothetical protein
MLDCRAMRAPNTDGMASAPRPAPRGRQQMGAVQDMIGRQRIARPLQGRVDETPVPANRPNPRRRTRMLNVRRTGGAAGCVARSAN